MTSKQKRTIFRLAIALVLTPLIFFFVPHGLVRHISFLILYLIIGGDILVKAGKNILTGHFLDEYFLMTVATLGAIFLREYFEACEVFFFFQVGELFQSYATSKSRSSIAGLIEIAPDYANVVRGDGIESVDPDEVEVGEIIVVRPGEKIPLDGVVVEGGSSINTANLTGESMPRDVEPGDEVLSGSVNLGGVLRLKTSRDFDDSAIMQILDMIENASSRKAKTERFITRFAHYYTPIVVGLSLIVAILPPISGFGTFSEWIERALVFLVVSCPCALVISVPLSFFSAIGRMSKYGVLVKGSEYVEKLSTIRQMVFDKTGTLTRGTFRVVAIHPETHSEQEILEIAAHAEFYSNHPISRSITEAYSHKVNVERISEYREKAGKGIEVLVDGHPVLIGNGKWMDEKEIPWHECHLTGTVVHISIDGEYAGHIVISDEIKEDSKAAITELKQLGFKQLVMLTGDITEVAKQISSDLGLTGYYAELLPGEKVSVYQKMKQETGKETAYVGDGLNDAPLLAQADLGVAMGAMGSGVAIDSADIILMHDRPSQIPIAVRAAVKTMRIVKANILFSIGVKVLVLILAIFGLSNMQLAIFADVEVLILVVLNAFRAM